MNKKLFEVQIRVHLTPEHPKFYEYQFGLLVIWLYAKDHQSAVVEAVLWGRPLPYELGGAKSFAIEDQVELQPYQKSCIPKTESMGRNLAFFNWPIGSDENAILGSWPGIVPLLNLPLPG
jgi:hypothetical protein